MCFEGRGRGDVGRGDVCEGGVGGFDGDREPKDDLRGLESGIPKRLCKRIRVDVGLERGIGSSGGAGGCR